MEIDKTKRIKILIYQFKALKGTIIRTLNDNSTMPTGRYASFKTYATQYNILTNSACKLLGITNASFNIYDCEKLPSWGNSVWPIQLQVIESVLLNTETMIAYLEAETEFSDDEFDNLESFLKTKLRSVVFAKPTKEIEIQNAVESLLLGKGWSKGIDYDRETGKVKFSGKEYIPDFVIPKLKLCIEIKLVREGKKSEIIEQINSDIIGYGKEYARQLFVVYDLGVIQNEEEFKRDIEKSTSDIRVVIIKH